MAHEIAFTTVAAALREPVAVLDLDGNIEFANPEMVKFLGEAEILGRSLADLLGATAEPVCEAFRRVRAADAHASLTVHDEPRGRWFDVSLVRVSQCVYVFFRDVTADHSAMLAAAATNRAKDDFIAMLGHELRTPLNAMLGWTQILRQRGIGTERSGRALETIERNTRVMAQLVDDIVDVARMTTGRLVLTVREVLLPEIVHAAMEVVRPMFEKKQIQVATTFDADVPRLTGDGDRLQQVVWNLLSNAAKFTPEGGNVHICVKREADAAVIEVTDDGCGIDGEFLPHVFERFRQADTSRVRKFGGLGLGLAITRSVVELHGGKISAHSDGDGKGTRMRVELPIAATNEAEALVHEESAPLSKTNVLRNRRILVVDDDEDVRELITTVFANAGAEVRAARSGVEALAIVDGWPPSIVVSDLGMPGMSGDELLRKFRELHSKSDVGAIALTGRTSAVDLRASRAAGFDVHLTKPVEPGKLLFVVTNMLRQRDP